MTDKKKVELLDCPFCGCKSDIVIIERPGCGTMYQIACDTIGCCGFVDSEFCSEEFATQAWNTRAKSTATMTEQQLWGIINAVDYKVEDYEVRGDNGDYAPNEHEKFLINDFHEGFLEELVKALSGKLPRPLVVEEYEKRMATMEELNKEAFRKNSEALSIIGQLSKEKDSLKSVIGRMVKILKDCEGWHKGEKWRNGTKEQKVAWVSHMREINDAISEGEKSL